MRYVCVVAYDGYAYNGYQIQKHDSNTVQETIQFVLSKVFCEKILIYGSGRTDKGVHAQGQVFHFDSLKEIPLERLKSILNRQLPLSIRIVKVKKADLTFHARHSVHRKVYEYKIRFGKDEDVFKNRYFAYVNEPIDLSLLKQCADKLCGTHDFRNFTTNKEEEVLDFHKTIDSIKILKSKKGIRILFYGSGFLKYQVRMMVGAMLVIATKKKDMNFLDVLLDEHSGCKCSYKAEPQGLYLKKVIY